MHSADAMHIMILQASMNIMTETINTKTIRI